MEICSTWGDHHSPLLHDYVEIIQSAYDFLSGNLSKEALADSNNVAVFHCNAGKGRTGSAICALILYTGLMDDVNEVLRYYAHQRFVGGAGGVTQPCQIRYIEYFHKLVKKQVKSAPPKMFRQMVVNYFPAGGGDIADSSVTAEFCQYHFENLVRSCKA